MTKYVDNPFDNPSILSLCPGVRGLERGLIRAIGPVRAIAYVEIEAFIIENLVCEMEQGLLDSAPIWSNVKTFDAKPFAGKVSGILAGYPCQPFSHAGARTGTDDPRHLYPFISGIIQAAGPIWCFFENVAGHLTLGFPEVSADLRSMGYSVEAGIYSAEEVGAPHERDRLFILAIKSEYVAHRQSGRIRRLSKCEQGQEWGEQRNSTDANGFNEDVVNSSKFGCYAKQEEFEQTETDGFGELSANEQIRRTIKCWPCESGSILPTGEKLEHTNYTGDRTPGSGINALRTHSGRRRGNITQLEPGGYGESNTPSGRHLLSDTEGPRLEGSIAKGNLSAGRCAGKYDDVLTKERWPARPGEEQYGWEELRVKPRLGSTINGYNFREDFLRALGNSVVEQTAEIAFIDLLNKHIKNMSK